MEMPVKYKGILIIILAFTLVVNRWESRLCVENSSVVKIYIIRPKPGLVVKMFQYIYIYIYLFNPLLCTQAGLGGKVFWTSDTSGTSMHCPLIAWVKPLWWFFNTNQTNCFLFWKLVYITLIMENKCCLLFVTCMLESMHKICI